MTARRLRGQGQGGAIARSLHSEGGRGQHAGFAFWQLTYRGDA